MTLKRTELNGAPEQNPWAFFSSNILRSVIKKLLDRGFGPEWKIRLISMEMAEPSEKRPAKLEGGVKRGCSLESLHNGISLAFVKIHEVYLVIP